MDGCEGIYTSYRISYAWAAAQLPPGYQAASVILPTDTVAVMDHMVLECEEVGGEKSHGPGRMAFAWIITANPTQPLRSFGYTSSTTMEAPMQMAEALSSASASAFVGTVAISSSAYAVSAIVQDRVEDYTVDAFAPTDAWIRATRNVTLVMDEATYWLEANIESSQGRLPATITVREAPIADAGLVSVPMHANSGFQLRGNMTLTKGR